MAFSAYSQIYMVCIRRWGQNRREAVAMHVHSPCICYSLSPLPFEFARRKYTHIEWEEERETEKDKVGQKTINEPHSPQMRMKETRMQSRIISISVFCVQFIWPLRSYAMRNTYVMSFIFCVCSFAYFFIDNCCCRWCCGCDCSCCCCCCWCCWYVVCSAAVMRGLCGLSLQTCICSSHYLSRSGWLQFLVHSIAFCVGTESSPKEGIVASLLCECMYALSSNSSKVLTNKTTKNSLHTSEKVLCCVISSFIVYISKNRSFFNRSCWKHRNQLTLAV